MWLLALPLSLVGIAESLERILANSAHVPENYDEALLRQGEFLPSDATKIPSRVLDHPDRMRCNDGLDAVEGIPRSWMVSVLPIYRKEPPMAC